MTRIVCVTGHEATECVGLQRTQVQLDGIGDNEGEEKDADGRRSVGARFSMA